MANNVYGSADGPVLPVILEGPGSALLGAAVTNKKGFEKSLERGDLWVLHPTSGRLISIASGRPAALQDRGAFYLASFGADADTGSISKALEALRASDAAAQVEGIAGPAEALREKSSNTNNILGNLEKLIKSRKIELPEGSYTSHLFSKGEDKIRKKAGEEAIELLLARTDNELVSEAADFLYHLLVLFVEKGIPFGKVLEELERR